MAWTYPKIAAALVSLALSASAPARAEGVDLERLRTIDQRLAAVAYRLVTANVERCSDRWPVTGLVLHDLTQYRPALRRLAQDVFNLGEGLGISSVVPDSPASRAGLKANDQLLAINHLSLVDVGGGRRLSAKADYSLFATKLTIVERELRRGAATLRVQRGTSIFELSLTPGQGCASRFQVVPRAEMNAWADGEHVSVTSELAEFALDDDELAVILSHELAHNVLQHRVRLRREGVQGGILRTFGRNARRVRETEIEADRTGLTFMKRAGFELAAAETFWRRYAQRLGLLRASTHPDVRQRLEIIRAMTKELGG